MDLLGRARFEEAARRAGTDATFVGERMPEALPSTVDLLVVDVDRVADEELAEAVSRIAAGRRLGVYSHVDDERRAAARRVGLEPITRGRFWTTLPELLGPGG